MHSDIELDSEAAITMAANGWRYNRGSNSWEKDFPGKEAWDCAKLINAVNSDHWMGNPPRSVQVIGVSGAMVSAAKVEWQATFRLASIKEAIPGMFPAIAFNDEFPGR